MDAQLDQIKLGERLPGVDELLSPASAASDATWISLPGESCRWRRQLADPVTGCESLAIPLPAVLD